MINEPRFPLGTDNRFTSPPSGLSPNGQVGGRRAAPKNQGYDWLGAVLRRKGILAFTIIVSGILGYLYFVRQPKVYASQLKLMIWTQAPPRIVDGETFVQPEAIGKHINLIKSQVVLENAVKNGDLQSLRTFGGNPAAVYPLKGMLSVEPVENAAETLLITARGPDPQDLPSILTSVVSAYEDNLMENSASISKSSVELIEKLQDQISGDKSRNEVRFRELIQKLGISPDATTRQYLNPFAQELEETKTQKSAAEKELRGISERLAGINDLQNLKFEERNDMIRVVAIEAARYLSLDARVATGLNAPDADEKGIQKWEERNEVLEDHLADLRLELSRIRRTVGDNHPSASRISSEIESTSTKLLAQREIVRRLKSSLAQKTLEENKPEAKEVVQTTFESDMIKWYSASLQRNADRLQNTIKDLELQVASLETKAAEVRGDVEELNFLARDIADKDTELREILDKMSSLTLLASNYTSTKVRVIDPPGVGSQVEPKLLVTMAVFLLAGGLIGFGIVALLDWSDLSYRNPNEIRDRLGLPVIARISKMPITNNMKNNISECLVTISKPKSPVAEAYRACRTAMLFSAKQQNLKAFLITSPAAGDGKSTTSLNLAMCFAQGGLKTVIVDADLRRPRCHAYLGLDPQPGLKDFSVGDATIEQITRPCEHHPNLSVVTAGKHFSNPSGFLDSAAFQGVMTQLREKFDIIIVDSPPVLPVADAMALSSLCDGVLLVMKIRKGVVLSSEKAVETLRSVNSNLLGIVVNQVEKMSHYSDYGKYGYNGYGGYSYYAGRYYGKYNDKYYEETPADVADDPKSNGNGHA